MVMQPEDVDAALVEKAMREYLPGLYDTGAEAMRHALAAVLPEIRAHARKELADDLTWLADAREEYAHGDVVKETDAVRVALGVAQGEPAWGWLPSWRWDEWKARAARMTTTTEEPK